MIYALVCDFRFVDFQKLKEMGRSRPLEGYVLSFCLLSAARTLRVTFGSEAMPSSYMLKLHFESFTGKKSVEKVNLAPPNEAFVTFKHSSSRYHACCVVRLPADCCKICLHIIHMAISVDCTQPCVIWPPM